MVARAVFGRLEETKSCCLLAAYLLLNCSYERGHRLDVRNGQSATKRLVHASAATYREQAMSVPWPRRRSLGLVHLLWRAQWIEPILN